MNGLCLVVQSRSDFHVSVLHFCQDQLKQTSEFLVIYEASPKMLGFVCLAFLFLGACLTGMAKQCATSRRAVWGNFAVQRWPGTFYFCSAGTITGHRKWVSLRKRSFKSQAPMGIPGSPNNAPQNCHRLVTPLSDRCFYSFHHKNCNLLFSFGIKCERPFLKSRKLSLQVLVQ